MYEQILYDVDDPVAMIRFNRPERLNAFTNRMGDELKHALAEAERDERVVAIVLTGEGRGFCAGADLKGLQGTSARAMPRRWVEDPTNWPKPAPAIRAWRASKGPTPT